MSPSLKHPRPEIREQALYILSVVISYGDNGVGMLFEDGQIISIIGRLHHEANGVKQQSLFCLSNLLDVVISNSNAI